MRSRRRERSRAWLPLVLCLAFTLAHAMAAAEVELSTALRFESPGGDELDVPAGRYRVTSDGASTITLTPVDGGVALELEADQSDHAAALTDEGAGLFVTDEGVTHLEWLGIEGDALLAVGESVVQERAPEDGKRPRKAKKRRRTRRSYEVGVCPRGYEIQVQDGEARCMGRTRRTQLRRAGTSRCLKPAELMEDVEDVDGVDQCELVELGTTQEAVCAPLAKMLSRKDGERIELTLKVVQNGRDVCMRKTFQLKQTDMLMRSTADRSLQ